MATTKQKAARKRFAALARAKHKGSAVGRAAASPAKKTPKSSNAKGRKQSPAQKAAFRKMLAARKRRKG